MNKSSLKKEGIFTCQLVTTKNSNKTLSTYISKANQLSNWPENMAFAIQQFISGSRARPKLNPVNRQTKSIGLKLVQKLMKQLQLKSVVIKKFKLGYSLSDHINRKNLIQTEPAKKNKVCSTDITYIPTQQGWAYLSTIMDCYTKKVITWDLGKRMTVELVQRTLNKAIKSQDYPEAVIFHSDKGSQYTSLEYEELLKYYGMTHSFSRRGYPYHNASLESWHGHLKRKWVYQFKYKNFEEACQSIFWYIEAFYNSKRIHQSLGYLTPNQFEKVSA
ncbi:IS3 family transposase [Streptococcus lutetiensis]|uniref:IS3 family transposase n=1 Tax=Streptococcus lutetiensis TaxID=150055 RepID=UPI003D6A0A4F